MMTEQQMAREKEREAQEVAEQRCSEQGHDYENCCSVLFRVYQRCKWCGQERNV